MAQELKSINLVAPAFKGVNTEDSPITQDPSFAEKAENAVIDKRGRIASRKGYVVLTSDNTLFGTDSPSLIKEFEANGGLLETFSAVNNKILKGTTALTDETPAGYTITDDNWKAVNFNDSIYFFQRDYEPLVYTNAINGLQKMSDIGGVGTNAANIFPAMYGNEAIAAYGRIWTVDTSANKSVIYWSDLLIGHDFKGGTSGSINLAKVWPDGYDEVIALAAYNGLLIILGKHSIIVYQGAEFPSTMTLADTVSGIGCVDRDTVQFTGTDVLFLSQSGLRSFARTLQTKNMPLTSLSKTVTKDLIALIRDESVGYKTIYSPEESFYLLSFIDQKITYVFDMRAPLEDGSLKTTIWPNSVFTAYEHTKGGDLLIGTTEGICKYDGYTDNGASYRFSYFSPSLTFGDSSRLKFIKKITPTIVGASGETASVKLAYDFGSNYETNSFSVPANEQTAFYGISFYDPDNTVGSVSYYTQASVIITKKGLNTKGSGSSVTVGLEADINGNELSLQEINVQALIGKIV